MSAVPATAAPASTTAVAAFLRGIGRRAVVFAELQAGAARGDAAVAVAIRAFRAAAPTLELAHWPKAFWSELLDAPALRETRTAASDWARIASGPRAALLLRLAAGLDETDAAQVLGVGVPAYRLALQSALVAASADFATLQAQLQRRIAAVPPERIERLTQDDMAAASEWLEAVPRPRPRALLAVLWALLMLCVAAFAMTFWWPSEPEAAVEAGVRVEPLPPAAAPASRFGDEAARVVHRDFALLVGGEAAPLVRELEFYGWLAAQQGVGASNADVANLQDRATLPDAGIEPFDTPGLETDDASL